MNCLLDDEWAALRRGMKIDDSSSDLDEDSSDEAGDYQRPRRINCLLDHAWSALRNRMEFDDTFSAFHDGSCGEEGDHQQPACPQHLEGLSGDEVGALRKCMKFDHGSPHEEKEDERAKAVPGSALQPSGVATQKAAIRSAPRRSIFEQFALEVGSASQMQPKDGMAEEAHSTIIGSKNSLEWSASASMS
eukprot:TRINITY_DN10215_c0_g1_i5.p1 TRINITY_DN10215_c0_g1~~TRINITY_DN10215_c0_g1_i5.p1  ORF type:complete len:190 (-),score=36.17 TRINITY_DN10215_c0_g1_i5:16-585(-)